MKVKKAYNHFKGIPELPEKVGYKKKKPRLMAVVDEDNCTGCLACVPFFMIYIVIGTYVSYFHNYIYSLSYSLVTHIAHLGYSGRFS